MRVFVAELRKLLILFRSDPRSIGAGIVAPTVILLAFAITIGNFASIKLAFVNEDSGDLGAVLGTSIFTQLSPLGNAPYFDEVVADEAEALDLYAQGRVSGVTQVGADFSEQLLGGGTPTIVYRFDNYNTDIAKNLRLYLSEGVLDFYRATDANLQIETEEILNVEQQLPWFNIVATGVFLLAFLLGVILNAIYLISMERRDETIGEYRLATNSIWPSLFARMVVALLAGTITAAVNALFIWLFTGINLASYVIPMAPPLLVLGLTYFFVAIAVALAVESFGGPAITLLVGTAVLWFLSGASFSIRNVTGPLREIALFIPNTFGLSYIRGSVFGMSPEVGGGVSYAAGWVVMLAYLLLSMGAAFAMHHVKLARSVR